MPSFHLKSGCGWVTLARMTSGRSLLPPGSLAARVEHATQHALSCGALQPIRTDQTFLEENKVQFVVRVVSSLARKDGARRLLATTPARQGAGANPFLPYDRDLFVADISDTHVCLLNK